MGYIAAIDAHACVPQRSLAVIGPLSTWWGCRSKLQLHFHTAWLGPRPQRCTGVVAKLLQTRGPHAGDRSARVPSITHSQVKKDDRAEVTSNIDESHTEKPEELHGVASKWAMPDTWRRSQASAAFVWQLVAGWILWLRQRKRKLEDVTTSALKEQFGKSAEKQMWFQRVHSWILGFHEKLRESLKQSRRLFLLFTLGVLLMLGKPLGSNFHNSSVPSATAIVRQQLPGEEQRRLAALNTARHVVVSVSGTTSDSSLKRGAQTCHGSGWLFDDKGHIVTSLHAIENAQQGSLRIRYSDLAEVPVRLVGVDKASDLAVLEAPPASSGSKRRLLPNVATDALRVGQDVYVVGDSYGSGQTVSRGVISSLEQSLMVHGEVPLQGTIQTDATIHSGNAGGPALNSCGQVVGMIVAPRVSGSGAQASGGIVMPVDALAARVASIISHGCIRRPNLGIHVGPDVLAEQLGVRGGGAVVIKVLEGDPAWEAGVRPGDVLTALDGRPVRCVDDLVGALEHHKPGETVRVFLRRPVRKAPVAGLSPGAQHATVEILVHLGLEPVIR